MLVALVMNAGTPDTSVVIVERLLERPETLVVRVERLDVIPVRLDVALVMNAGTPDTSVVMVARLVLSGAKAVVSDATLRIWLFTWKDVRYDAVTPLSVAEMTAA